MIKNVIFDIGNVLIYFAWKEAMIKLGFSDETIEILDKNLINNDYWDELDRGRIPEDDVINQLCKKLPQLENEIRLFWENNLLTIEPYDYSKPWIISLKEKGLNVYLLTNYPDSLFKKSVESRFPFYTYVDGEVVSSRVKYIKPEKEIYEILFDRYNINPEESVFFDDRPKNINAAKKLGLNAFVFEGYEKAQEILNSLLEQK